MMTSDTLIINLTKVQEILKFKSDELGNAIDFGKPHHIKEQAQFSKNTMLRCVRLLQETISALQQHDENWPRG